jgi:AcrR family transcriptional regulator
VSVDPEVLEAGRRTLRRHGWSGTTAERIAEEAGVSRVTLHRRGIKREDVLAGLGELAAEAYREALWPALVAGGSGRERLEAALDALCRVAEAHLEVLAALQAASDAVFHEDAAPDAAADTRPVFTEPLERLLRDGAADDTLRTVDDVHETAVVLFNAAGWTYVHLRTGHRWKPDRARAATLDLLLNGLAASS